MPHPPDLKEHGITGARRKRTGSMAAAVMALVAGVMVLMTLVIVASVLNRADYYLKAAHGAVEIWQGRFAPMGRERILILPGAELPPAVKSVYRKNEISAFAFTYYVDRADMLLEAPDMPDFNGTRLYLKTALSHAVTDEMRRMVFSRLNRIDMMVYLYKADVAASRGTLADFNKALQYLAKAADLALDTAQLDLIDQKTSSIRELMAALQRKNAGLPEAVQTVPADRRPAPPAAEPPAK